MTPEEARKALIGHFARPNCEMCSEVAQAGLVLWQALASQRQTIIDEMVRPLMDALQERAVAYQTEHFVAHDGMTKILAAVESKLSESEKKKETKPT